ncbi:Acid phosphatase [Aphelenchoides bicaudatus]|nr:Acid phosphatase [Aphelenchoides bicaudatus]
MRASLNFASFALITFCALSAFAKPLNTNDDELVFVHAIWRHGDRAPNMAFPTDPNQEDAWPQGWGSLSAVGMHQQLQLGRRLRSHLKDFVSRHYLAQEVYVRASDVNRTLASAISNMIGFFDHEQKEQGKDYPKDEGLAKSMPETCPRMEAVKKLLEHSPEYKKLEHDNKKLLDKFSKLIGMKLKLKDTFHVHDTLFIEQTNNKTWADGITQDLYDQLGQLTNEFLNLKYGIGLKPYNGVDFSTELPKLNGGWILGDMLDRMKQKRDCIENKPTDITDPCNWIGRLKYFAYSAHEETLASAFRVFGIESTDYKRSGMPIYASALTIELWRNNKNNEYFVKVNYFPRDEDTVDITKDIVGCESGCSLDEFENRSNVYRLLPNANTVCLEEI